MSQPLMPKGTAVWLLDNTTLTFEQIADFLGMHVLEVTGIADGEVAVGIKGLDPVANNQLTREEISRCEKNPRAKLQLVTPRIAAERKRKGPRYTPLSKRQDRPNAIAWLLRNHPELSDAQIIRLVGTTRNTIEAVSTKSHWNSQNIKPVDPVALGLCRQSELDEAVRVATARAARDTPARPAMEEEESGRLSALETPGALRAPKGFEGLENFSLGGGTLSESRPAQPPEPDGESLFNLPATPRKESQEGDDEDARS